MCQLNGCFYFWWNYGSFCISLFTFVPLMNKMLNDYKELTMSVLTGLMAGSLITLWPWKEDYGKGSLPDNLSLGIIFEEFSYLSIIITVIFFVLGVAGRIDSIISDERKKVLIEFL